VSQSFIQSLYNVGLLLLLFLGSPWWLLKYVTSERFREGLGQRFFGPSKSFAAALPPGGHRIWIHAVSVGEVFAISGLVRELTVRSPQCSLVISTTTRTGQAVARKRFGAERCFYFPLDFPWSVRAVIKRLRPSMLVLAESELWPNVLTACGRARIPVVVVNARVSDRSFPRYMWLRPLWRPFLQMLASVMAQTREDAWRLQEIGVPGDRIKVVGNLKFDIRAPQSSALSSLLRQHLATGAKLLVCGSTLEGEESLLLAAWPRILATVPDAVMLLAPRHPERFDRLAALLALSQLPWVRRSQWITDPGRLADGTIFLLDSIGELASLYALARIAFIGGSLVPSGGHNPLEPAQFGVPIATGPHYENFREIVDLLRARDAIRILNPAAIDVELSMFLRDDYIAARTGQNAKLAFEQQAGASGRAADAILALLSSGDIP
jgi:3-deoxy-D-manno-octulosonic-acid transferase